MGRDALEQLQCLLLTALYSIMRPMKPGVWYCLGVGIAPHHGYWSLHGNTWRPRGFSRCLSGRKRDIGRKEAPSFLVFLCTRSTGLRPSRTPFWHRRLGHQVNLPWVDSESDMEQVSIGGGEDHAQRAEAGDEDNDSSIEIARREAASTLPTSIQHQRSAKSFGLACLATKPKDASRWVSLSFFACAYSKVRSSRCCIRMPSFHDVSTPMLIGRLISFGDCMPGDAMLLRQREPLEASGCGYNPISSSSTTSRLTDGLWVLSPPSLTPHARIWLASKNQSQHHQHVCYASKEGQMNYTWMTGHNVFYRLHKLSVCNLADQCHRSRLVPLQRDSRLPQQGRRDPSLRRCLRQGVVLASMGYRREVPQMFAHNVLRNVVVVEKIDRMSAARTGGQARIEGASDQDQVADSGGGKAESPSKPQSSAHHSCR